MSSYGEMTTLHMGCKTWILLNSARVANEIITKRSSITHERPQQPIAHDLVSHSRRSVMRRSKDWAPGRRVMHRLLSGSQLKIWCTTEGIESIDLLKAYLQEPKQWSSHHYRYATGILYRIVMGYALKKSRKEMNVFQTVAFEFIWSLNRSVIDFFPLLSKLPTWTQPWRPFWKDMGDRHREAMFEWWVPIKAAVDAGAAEPSFVRDVLLACDSRYLNDDEEAMYLAASVVAAGGDNMRMTMNTFVMAMISHPEVQHRGREELDRICEYATRLPVLEDLANAPYVASMVKEVLRWRPTVPLIPPHELTEDLEFEGHLFKAGTCFLINSIALSNEWENADRYDPARWTKGEASEQEPVAHFFGFGGGRRICVGYKVAQQALSLAIARILYCFDITPVGHSQSIVHAMLTFDLERSVRYQKLESPVPRRAVSSKIRCS